MNPANLWPQGQVGGYCFIKPTNPHALSLTILHVTLSFEILFVHCRWFSDIIISFVRGKNKKKNDCLGKESNKSFVNLVFQHE